MHLFFYSISAEKGKIPIHKNMPYVTGGLKWAQELRERISIPMSNFKNLEHPYVYMFYKIRIIISWQWV